MNKTLKAGLFTAAVALVTSGLVGSTMANYVTTTISTDQARVAVWGINGDRVSMDLFYPGYEGSVVSATGDNVIAPGTSGSSRFSILNMDRRLAPETDYEVTIDVDHSTIDPLIENNPSIQFRLDKEEWGSWDQLLDSIKMLSGDSSGTKKYDANQIADAFAAGKTHVIEWRWNFDGDNTMDTRLGNEAALRNLPVDVVVSVTASQVD